MIFFYSHSYKSDIKDISYLYIKNCINSGAFIIKKTIKCHSQNSARNKHLQQTCNYHVLDR